MDVVEVVVEADDMDLSHALVVAVAEVIAVVEHQRKCRRAR